MKDRIAIDLLWLRPGKVGGTESYIRNLLSGMMKLEEEFHFVLITSLDNEETFRHYLKDKRIEMIVADIESKNIGKRIIWQWIHQNRLLRQNGLKYCFTPVYCRPLLNGGIQYVNTIHDIQAYHYPKYHPYYEVAFSKLNWLVDKYFSKHIVAISEFVKQDLVDIYHFNPDKIDVIYNPILIDKSDVVPFDTVKEKYRIEKEEYYYSVSQLIPHKNFDTLIDVFKQIKDNQTELPCKLLVSGINGNAGEALRQKLKQFDLEDNIILTGFVDNNVRNTLYQNCKAFLFPSVFEGFGMTAVEAMYWGRPVLTTKCASIPEVTQWKANYVDDPYDVEEWIQKMGCLKNQSQELDFSKYEEKKIAKKYLQLITEQFQII